MHPSSQLPRCSCRQPLRILPAVSCPGRAVGGHDRLWAWQAAACCRRVAKEPWQARRKSPRQAGVPPIWRGVGCQPPGMVGGWPRNRHKCCVGRAPQNRFRTRSQVTTGISAGHRSYPCLPAPSVRGGGEGRRERAREVKGHSAKQKGLTKGARLKPVRRLPGRPRSVLPMPGTPVPKPRAIEHASPAARSLATDLAARIRGVDERCGLIPAAFGPEGGRFVPVIEAAL